MPLLEVLVWVLCLVVLSLVVHHLRRSGKHTSARVTPAAAADNDLFETAPIGYVEIDREGIVQRANQQFAKLVGRSRAELVGQHSNQLAPASQREKYAEQIKQRMSGETALTPYQAEYERPDGGKVVVEAHEELLKGASGQVIGMRLAVVDITQRKKSDEHAFQIAAELRALFQAFPDFFLRLDGDGNVHEAKGGEKSDPFLSANKFVGRNIQEVLPPDGVNQFLAVHERVKRTKSLGIAEFSVDTYPEPQTYELRLLELDWEWIAIVRNTTSRKADEAKLQEYAQELERKNEEMEAALTTAREATQLKSRFLATMSHEIRTPMNGVLGMTELLLASTLQPEQQECAQSIKRSASSLLSLSNDMLDLSRLEAGRLTMRPVAFSLKAILDETASLFAPQAHAKGLEFKLEVAPNVPATVVSDPERLRQILNNLLGNAVKFTEAGRIGLTVVVQGESAESSQIRFTVHDTGIGVAAEQHDWIFERFTQADTSSTRKYGGTGLGLALSKELVELLGGEIGVESELGRGSQFWFTVELGKASQPVTSRPAEQAPSAKPAAPAARPVVKITIPATAPGSAATNRPAQPTAQKRDGLASLTAAVKGRNQRVLLAEDNEVNQRIMLRLLEKLGVQVDAVRNGREAVQAVIQKSYSLIFMDCQMPDMDGYEATAVIRNREEDTRHTPICALTANAMEGDRERCLAAGMDDYIAKPVSVEKLREAIERWMPGAARPIAQPTPPAVRS